MQYSYKTSGTCSREIVFEIEDNKVKNELECEYDLAWRYAINPLGQNPDSLVKVLRGNDYFLYKFYKTVASFCDIWYRKKV